MVGGRVRTGSLPEVIAESSRLRLFSEEPRDRGVSCRRHLRRILTGREERVKRDESQTKAEDSQK